MTALTVAGLSLVARPSGALWIESARALVVADLHLEKGSAYASRGQMLPPWDTRETLRRLSAEVAAMNPRQIVMLGDSLHDRKAAARLADEDLGAIHALSRAANLVWVAGNHDADGLETLPGEIAPDIAFGALTFRHEPRPGADHPWAAGHLHPCARVSGGAAGLRRRCFVTDGERIVLPAFGAYAGGLNVRDEAFAGLFSKKPTAVVLGQSRAYAVAWGRLRGD